MVIKQAPHEYRLPLNSIRLYRDDLQGIWRLLNESGDVRVTVTARPDEAELTEPEDFARLRMPRLDSILFRTSDGIEVALNKHEGYIAAEDPTNTQLGVIGQVAELVGWRNHNLVLLWMVISAPICVLGVYLNLHLASPWNQVALWTGLALGILMLVLGIRATPAVILNTKPRSESFWSRKKEDIGINAAFVVIGAVIGFILGRI